MAQTISLVDNHKTCLIKLRTDGSDKFEDNNPLIIFGIIAFIFLNIAGLLILGVILVMILHEETLIIDKNNYRIILQRQATFAGSTISNTRLECRLDEVDLFTEDSTSSSSTLTLYFPARNNKRQKLKFTLNRSVSQERNIYNILTSLSQTAKLSRKQRGSNNPDSYHLSSAKPVVETSSRSMPQRSKPDAHAPNISITDDEMTYKRTLVTSRDYWGLYWSFILAVSLIVGGISLAVFAIFPLIRFYRQLYLVYIPLGLFALGIIFKGIHTILFKLIATKISETVHFNKMAQVITLEDRFLTSKSTTKYLYEQVELKLENQKIGSTAYLEQSHAVILVFNSASDQNRKVELVRTSQYHQAVDLYNNIAEVLYQPPLPLGSAP